MNRPRGHNLLRSSYGHEFFWVLMSAQKQIFMKILGHFFVAHTHGQTLPPTEIHVIMRDSKCRGLSVK